MFTMFIKHARSFNLPFPVSERLFDPQETYNVNLVMSLKRQLSHVKVQISDRRISDNDEGDTIRLEMDPRKQWAALRTIVGEQEIKTAPQPSHLFCCCYDFFSEHLPSPALSLREYPFTFMYSAFVHLGIWPGTLVYFFSGHILPFWRLGLFFS